MMRYDWSQQEFEDRFAASLRESARKRREAELRKQTRLLPRDARTWALSLGLFIVLVLIMIGLTIVFGHDWR